jgi:hypothetical protein
VNADARTIHERLAAGETIPLEEITDEDWDALTPRFAEQWRAIQRMIVTFVPVAAEESEAA